MKYSKGRKVYIAISAIAVLAVLITIFCLSAQNGEDSSATSGFFTRLITTIAGQPVEESIVRTLAHFCEFASLGLLVTNLFFAIDNKLKPFLSISLSLGYALTDEIHQIFVPGRAFQLFDLAVDLGGIILGTAICFIVLLLFKSLNCSFTKKERNIEYE